MRQMRVIAARRSQAWPMGRSAAGWRAPTQSSVGERCPQPDHRLWKRSFADSSRPTSRPGMGGHQGRLAAGADVVAIEPHDAIRPGRGATARSIRAQTPNRATLMRRCRQQCQRPEGAALGCALGGNHLYGYTMEDARLLASSLNLLRPCVPPCRRASDL